MEDPPGTFSEIQMFWICMFGLVDALASIQVQRDHPFTTYLWHGDIKPETILDVRGRFKMVDWVTATPEKFAELNEAA
ncbi:putative protein kinase domain protein [Rosellinia necatrix]|uniref:Protein kinase domain-containing protein n=1 Tax=Rosellinia necatrix TaxID=77044 RepID=A0A1S8AAF6_ROSNE|nr:putative protein kinase domain protein [Rosellinia necatrix]